MYRLTAALAILLVGAAVAAAALIQGQPGRSERITGRTDQVDRILAGRGDDVVFARDHLADYVNCGPGDDVAVLDRIDRAIGCETRRYPPKPTTLAPSPVGLVKAGPGGSVTPLPKKNCLHRRRGCPPPPPPPPEPEPEPPPPVELDPLGIPGSWTPAFADEFSGTSLDLAKWRPNWFGATDTSITKGANSSEDNCVDPALSTVSGGFLHMRNIVQTTTCTTGTQPYRSALVSSNPSGGGNFQFTYGVAEARFFSPTPGGGVVPNWSGFWTTGHNWPATGEIDVMEALGGRATFNFHYESGGVHQQMFSRRPAGDWTGWHTYAVKWQPGRLDFYWDGVLMGSWTTGVTNAPHYLILQNATGTSADMVPSEVLVDYVRVWT